MRVTSLGHVSEGPTLFLLQLPEWEGSGRSSPAGSCPPFLLSSAPGHGRDLFLGTATLGDRKEKEKLTGGRGRRVPSALRGRTDACRVAPGFSIQQTQPRLCQSLVRSLKPNQGFDSPCVKEAWILGWGLKGSLPSIQDGREQSSFGFLVVDLDFDILHL